MDPNLRAAEWIRRRVRVLVDRPLGSQHPNGGHLVDELNQGFRTEHASPRPAPHRRARHRRRGPLHDWEAEVLAVIRRRGDVRDKLDARIGPSD